MNWPLVPLGELLTLREPDVEVAPDQEYHFAGVYCFGRGAFVGQKRSGREFAYPRLTRLHTDNFLYPKLMAWEGAYARVPSKCDGLVVSTEFPVFAVNTSKLVPAFLGSYFQRSSVWPELTANAHSWGSCVDWRVVHCRSTPWTAVLTAFSERGSCGDGTD